MALAKTLISRKSSDFLMSLKSARRKATRWVLHNEVEKIVEARTIYGQLGSCAEFIEGNLEFAPWNCSHFGSSEAHVRTPFCPIAIPAV